MTLRASEVGAVAEEVGRLLAGARVRRLLAGGPREVLVEFDGDRPPLLVSTHPALSRLHLLRLSPPPRPGPSDFAARLDRRLRGKALDRVACAGGDRVVRLRFGELDLVAELFGPASNLLLLDGGERILEVERPRSGARPLRVGDPYVPPPAPPGPPREPSRFAGSPSPGDLAPLNAAVEAHYREAARAEALENRRSELLRRVGARLKNRRARVEGLALRGLEVAKAQEVRRKGELLKANWARLRRGLSSIEVADLFDPFGATLRIELDPALDARGNVERYFRRFRKLADAAGPLERERAIVGAEIALLERAQGRIEAAADLDALLAEEEELKAARTLPTRGARPARRGEEEGRRPLRFSSADGLEILVGGDARENDRLTFSIARGNDLWLHARDAPGAHVVVRLPKGKTAPLETLLDAAALAVHFSKRRGAGRAEVLYAPVKLVRKPRGAAPGLVVVVREKTLAVAEDRARIERLTRPAAGLVDPAPGGG
ncbi:MAG TPA: NFACT RNA binding domain-containing protein [Planctomycetota bacterium]|nr:NFACT RNA binding domain-containing protein [Planctomycetota bacterium]